MNKILVRGNNWVDHTIIIPANFAELDPIEFLALSVGHPVADDHWRGRLFVFGHLLATVTTPSRSRQRHKLALSSSRRRCWPTTTTSWSLRPRRVAYTRFIRPRTNARMVATAAMVIHDRSSSFRARDIVYECIFYFQTEKLRVRKQQN